MEVTSDRSTDLIFTEGSATRSRPSSRDDARAKAQRQNGGSDRGVRGTVQRKCEEEERPAPTRKTRRSGSGVVKRQVLRSLGDGCKPVDQERGASLEETPETNEARVLVVEAVGSRSRSVRIGIELRVESQDEPQKGGLARSKSSNLLAQATMTQRWACYGSSSARKRVGSAEVPSNGGVRAKRYAGITPNCHRGGMRSDFVRRRKASSVRS